MDLCEVGQLSLEQERDHWWIRTRFHYLNKAIEQAPRKRSIRVLEAGCGTAQNMRHLREHPTLSQRIDVITGLEPHIPQDIIHEPWMGTEDSIHRSMDGMENNYDVLVAMDVLEHIENDQDALQSWLRFVKPGGIVFITVPAFQSLWSEHDIALGHVRRYSHRSLKKLALRTDLEVLKIRYAFSYLLPPLYLLRRIFPVLGIGKKSELRTDFAPTHRALNEMLCQMGKAESLIGGCPLGGSSVIGYFRKKTTS